MHIISSFLSSFALLQPHILIIYGRRSAIRCVCDDDDLSVASLIQTAL